MVRVKLASKAGAMTTHASAFTAVKHAIVPLNSRCVFEMKGPDSKNFLQKFCTQDVSELDESGSMYAAFLNAKGRFLFDALIRQTTDDTFLLDCAADQTDIIAKHFRFFKFRSNFEFNVKSDVRVWSALSVDAESIPIASSSSSTAFRDPRLAALGTRFIEHREDLPDLPDRFTPLGEDFYEAFRISHGVPLSGTDMIAEKSLPLECNLDWLSGVSFSKGCYLGQELTQRTHHQGSVRKRLMPVLLTKQPVDMSAQHQEAITESLFPDLFDASDELQTGDDEIVVGRKKAKVFSRQGNLAIAQVRSNFLDHGHEGEIAGRFVKPIVPGWWPQESS